MQITKMKYFSYIYDNNKADTEAEVASEENALAGKFFVPKFEICDFTR